MRTICLALLQLAILPVYAQYVYAPDSLVQYREQYVNNHGVVKGEDRQGFRFFPPDGRFCVPVRLEKIDEAPWFKMETSGVQKKMFRVYGILHFTLMDTVCKLPVYQSQSLMKEPQYASLLFLPFTDKTTGEESYEAGRYIDLTIPELENPGFRLDLNKAYNPYCAYISQVYNCPIPPRENYLPVAVRAGEMKFNGGH